MWFSASIKAPKRAAAGQKRRGQDRPDTRQLRLRPSVLHLEPRRLLSIGVVMGSPPWVEQGPEPILRYNGENTTPQTSVGAIESAVVEPKASGYIVYAGTVNGGIWRSDNITSGMFNSSVDPALAAWRPLTDNQPSLSTSSMALDPNDLTGNTLWVGTGSLSSGGSGGPGVGLLKTTDGGNTWTVLGSDLPHVPILRVLPTKLTDTISGPGHGGQIVLVATAQDGIYYSGDGGQTFSSELPSGATDVAEDPTAPGTFYAAVPGQGVYVSSDNGIDWPRKVTTGDMTTSPNMRIAVATDPSTGNTILWVATTQTLYRSPVLPDGSIDFTQVGQSPYDPAVRSDALQALSITADPTDPNTAYVAKFGELLLRFTYAPGDPQATNNGYEALLDSGYLNDLAVSKGNSQYSNDYQNLDPVTRTFPHGDFRSLTFLNPKTLLETDDGGIYGVNVYDASGNQNPKMLLSQGEYVVQLNTPGWVSLAGGDANQLSSSIRDTEFYSVAYDPLNGVIVGASQDNGTASQEGGPSSVWNSILGGDGFLTAADPTTIPKSVLDPTLYAVANPVIPYKLSESSPGYPPSGTFATAANPNGMLSLASPTNPATPYSGLNTNDQQTMVSASTGAGGDNSIQFVLNTQSGITDPEPMLYGMTGIYESIDGGDTVWDVSPPNMTGHVTALAYGSGNSGLAAYVATDSGLIWVRNDLAQNLPSQTFALVPPPSWGFGVYARKIVMDPDDYHNAYVLDSNNNVWQLQFIDFGQPTTSGELVPATQAIWTNITDNLPAVANDQGTIDLRSLEIYDPTPGITPGDGILLVGGLGGVYVRRPTGLGGYFWSKFGTNSFEAAGTSFPNVLVTDLHYIPPNPVNPRYGDILLAGTFGRGAWTVSQAGAYLSQPSILAIAADPGGPNQIRLIMDPVMTNPPTVDVFQNNSSTVPDFQIPLADINLIQVQSVGIPTTLTVDESNGLIPSEIEFLGGSGNDTLVINDHQDPIAENITLGTDQVSGLGPGIVYTNVNDVQLIGGNQPEQTYTLANADPVAQTELDTGASADGVGNFVAVQQTAGAVTINSGGYDTITVHDPNGLLDIQGALTVKGFLDESTLTLDDRGDFSPNLTFTLTDTAITNLAPATITYGGVGHLDIKTGNGDDEAQVLNTAPPIKAGQFIIGTTVTNISNGSTGNLVALVTGTQSELDVAGAFLVAVGNGTLQSIQGQVFVFDSGLPVVDLLVDDGADTQAEKPVLRKLPTTGYGVSGLAPALIAFGGGVGLDADGFGPGGTFTVDDTPAGVNTKIESTGTVDVLGTTGDLEVQSGTLVNVGGTGNGLDSIQAPVTINGAAALNYLDQGTTPGQTLAYTVSANQLSRTATATVYYSGVANVNVSAANAASTGFNTFYISTTAAGTTYNISAGSSGVTEFAVANNSSLDGILGSLYLHGQPGPGANDFALVSDFLNLAVHTYTLSTGEFQRDGMSPIFYDGLTLWEVFTGQGADAVNILSAGARVSTVVAASSANTVTVGTPTADGHTLQNILGSLLVAPTSSVEPTVLIDDSGNPSTAARTVTFDNKDPYGYRIHNLAPGDLYLRPGTGSPVTVKGDGGNQTFAFEDLPPSIPMALDGGSGTNTLDYSQYTGDITADLQLGVATGLSGGISNMQNVNGSQGNNLIVGDGNANVLTGGTGRNVLIGGAGPDTLDASGATSDNLLIGGSTDFDTNLAALDAIFAEWTRTDLGFKDRFSDLTSGTNGAGATPLNQLNGQFVLLTPKTVHADSSPDTLIGTNQTDPGTGNRAHNWFFFDSDDVLVNFLSSRDHKTKVK